MSSPEERAARVLKEFYSTTDWRHTALLETLVSEIRAAVAEERERCAMIVADGEWEEGADLPETLGNIVAAIREGE